MLSYRHGFHAGNHADLLKHLTLVSVLTYLQRKDKGIDVIDTHAGAGAYALQSAETAKTGEYAAGVGRWLAGTAAPVDGLAPLLDAIAAWRADDAERQDLYPGSPALACAQLRPQDAAFLFELHPTDHDTLAALFRRQRAVTVRQADGFAGLKALLPRKERRALVLIDPSYEVKGDYEAAVEAVLDGYRRMATAVFLLWYPVVERPRVKAMARRLAEGGIGRLLQVELGVRADTPGRGMTASGLFVVNAPFTLAPAFEAALPALAQTLREDAAPHWAVQRLAGD